MSNNDSQLDNEISLTGAAVLYTEAEIAFLTGQHVVSFEIIELSLKNEENKTRLQRLEAKKRLVELAKAEFPLIATPSTIMNLVNPKVERSRDDQAIKKDIEIVGNNENEFFSSLEAAQIDIEGDVLKEFLRVWSESEILKTALGHDIEHTLEDLAVALRYINKTQGITRAEKFMLLVSAMGHDLARAAEKILSPETYGQQDKTLNFDKGVKLHAAMGSILLDDIMKKAWENSAEGKIDNISKHKEVYEAMTRRISHAVLYHSGDPDTRDKIAYLTSLFDILSGNLGEAQFWRNLILDSLVGKVRIGQYAEGIEGVNYQTNVAPIINVPAKDWEVLTNIMLTTTDVDLLAELIEISKDNTPMQRSKIIAFKNRLLIAYPDHSLNLEELNSSKTAREHAGIGLQEFESAIAKILPASIVSYQEHMLRMVQLFENDTMAQSAIREARREALITVHILAGTKESLQDIFYPELNRDNFDAKLAGPTKKIIPHELFIQANLTEQETSIVAQLSQYPFEILIDVYASIRSPNLPEQSLLELRLYLEQNEFSKVDGFNNFELNFLSQALCFNIARRIIKMREVAIDLGNMQDRLSSAERVAIDALKNSRLYQDPKNAHPIIENLNL